MRMHPILGARILQPIKAFRQILNVVLHHHEWYDGSGYPDGLAGQNIPLHARIVSVCDAYHAMTSTRPYRQRRTPEFALPSWRRERAHSSTRSSLITSYR